MMHDGYINAGPDYAYPSMGPQAQAPGRGHQIQLPPKQQFPFWPFRILGIIHIILAAVIFIVSVAIVGLVSSSLGGSVYSFSYTLLVMACVVLPVMTLMAAATGAIGLIHSPTRKNLEGLRNAYMVLSVSSAIVSLILLSVCSGVNYTLLLVINDGGNINAAFTDEFNTHYYLWIVLCVFLGLEFLAAVVSAIMTCCMPGCCVPVINEEGTNNFLYKQERGKPPMDAAYQQNGYPNRDQRMMHDYPDADPRMMRDYPDADPRMMRDYPEADPRMMRDYPDADPRMMRDYPEADPRMMRDYPEADPRMMRDYPDADPRMMPDYPDADPRMINSYPDVDPRMMMNNYPVQDPRRMIEYPGQRTGNQYSKRQPPQRMTNRY